MTQAHVYVLLCLSAFAIGLAVGVVIGPEREVEREVCPEDWNDALACVEARPEASSPPPGGLSCTLVSKLWVRNCIDTVP